MWSPVTMWLCRDNCPFPLPLTRNDDARHQNPELGNFTKVLLLNRQPRETGKILKRQFDKPVADGTRPTPNDGTEYNYALGFWEKRYGCFSHHKSPTNLKCSQTLGPTVRGLSLTLEAIYTPWLDPSWEMKKMLQIWILVTAKIFYPKLDEILVCQAHKAAVNSKAKIRGPRNKWR